MYTLTFRYSLDIVCAESPMGSKFHFFQLIFIDKYILKTQGNWIFNSYIKFDMWTALFYIYSLYFQRWNSNCKIAFFNSFLDSKLGFLNVGLRLYYKCFPNSKMIENWDLLMLL